MTRLIASRLLQLPLILAAVFLLTFSLAWMIPGNPLTNADGRRPSPEIEKAMIARYRLDNPVTFAVDYLDKASGFAWLRGAHARPFDLGPSLRFQDVTVNRILAAGLPVSVTIGLTSILLALLIGLTAGVVGAMWPGSMADSATLAVALVGISLPSFVVGAAMLIVFAVILQWFPIGGWGGWRHLFLPSLTLSLPFAAYIARLVRFGMIEQMEMDYIRTARAKGLSTFQAALRHALKNAFLPVLSYLGPAAAVAMTGSFVVERVFAAPGIGQHFVDAVINKDITLVMGIVLVYSTMLVLFNLMVDLLYRWIDPRIELL